MADEAHVTIPDSSWEPIDGEDRLITTLVVNGTMMHLEAVRVVSKPNAIRLELVSDTIGEAIDRIAGDDAGNPETTMIGRRRYVLVATPFSS